MCSFFAIEVKIQQVTLFTLLNSVYIYQVSSHLLVGVTTKTMIKTNHKTHKGTTLIMDIYFMNTGDQGPK